MTPIERASSRPVREYIRITPEQLDARAAELEADGWRVVGAHRYSAGEIAVLLFRDLPAPRSER